MSKRRRVNISVDPDTYERLQRIKEQHGFKNVCELVVALVNILLDRLDTGAPHKYDLPEDDGAYIDDMFNELGHVQRTPDGTVPVRHNRKSIK